MTRLGTSFAMLIAPVLLLCGCRTDNGDSPLPQNGGGTSVQIGGDISGKLAADHTGQHRQYIIERARREYRNAANIASEELYGKMISCITNDEFKASVRKLTEGSRARGPSRDIIKNDLSQRMYTLIVSNKNISASIDVISRKYIRDLHEISRNLTWDADAYPDDKAIPKAINYADLNWILNVSISNSLSTASDVVGDQQRNQCVLFYVETAAGVVIAYYLQPPLWADVVAWITADNIASSAVAGLRDNELYAALDKSIEQVSVDLSKAYGDAMCKISDYVCEETVKRINKGDSQW